MVKPTCLEPFHWRAAIGGRFDNNRIKKENK
jgi:hypothetical protein